MMKFALMLGILSLNLLFGCGESIEAPKLVKVTGTVTHTTGPVEKGSVNFIAVGNGIGGQAKLQAGGKYSLEVTAGDFNVSVAPLLIKTPDTATSPGGEVYEEVKNIPTKYRSTNNSGLKVNVSATASTHDFKLE